jgi:pyruvate kinase
MGPACAGEVLPHLLAAGMNVARLNFSHGAREDHGEFIRRLREMSAQMDLPLAILQDLAGPKLRIGAVAGGEIVLQAGQVFVLTSVPGEGGPHGASVNYAEVISETPVGVPILLADGRIELQVESKTSNTLRCRVVAGGLLRSQVGLNFPQHTVSVPAFTAKDREDLRFGVQQGVDFVALSYVCSPQDILEARNFLHGLDADTPIIAKIEKHEALERLPDILAEADGLMVARGDLGLEVPLEQVPMIQKEIIALANQAGKPVITATQMLLSMVDSPRPSRAEATDVANAILDGTDAVMLSEETAAGRYPVEAVKFLDKVARTTEERFPYVEWLHRRRPASRQDIAQAISYAACEMALDLEAAAILTSTYYGSTARLISRFRPQAPIIGVTPRAETTRRLCLSWGVFPLLAPTLEDADHMLQLVTLEALKAGMLVSGERVVITAGTPMGVPGSTNLIKAEVVT